MQLSSLSKGRSWKQTVLIASCVLVLSLAATLQGQGQPGAAGQKAPRIRALVITGGCCHDYALQDKIVMDIVSKALPVDWTVVLQGGTGTSGFMPVYDSPDWAKGYDVVVHNECFADTSDEAFIKKITAAHKGGVPALVVHCAMHSYRAAKADDWREFLGVTSRRHTKSHNISVKIVAPDHVIMKGWKADWVTPVDELYVIDKLWPNVTALASAVSPEDKNEYALAWVHEYGGARVFGTTLGHGNDTWADPVYQDLLVRGFKWAVNKP